MGQKTDCNQPCPIEWLGVSNEKGPPPQSESLEQDEEGSAEKLPNHPSLRRAVATEAKVVEKEDLSRSFTSISLHPLLFIIRSSIVTVIAPNFSFHSLNLVWDLHVYM
jgi:hypothetical protein